MAEPLTKSDRLRTRAEDLIRRCDSGLRKVDADDFKVLLHELQVQQIELEMQNEELRRAEEELSHARDSLSDLYEFAPVGYITLDTHGKIRQANRAAVNLLGVERPDLAKASLLNFVMPASQRKFLLHQKSVLRSQEKEICEVPLLRPDGRRLVCRLESVSCTDFSEGGRAGAAMIRMALMDVTAEKEAEVALQQLNIELENRVALRTRELHDSEERFRQLAENIDAVFWLMDTSSTSLLYINPACETVYGLSRKSLMANVESFLKIVHPDDRDRFSKSRLIRREESFEIHFRIIRPDKEVRFIRTRSFPVRDDRGRIYRVGGISEDVTEEVQAEQTVSKAVEEENTRIAVDLHDGVCSQLTAIQLHAGLLFQELSRAGSPLASLATEIRNQLKDAITQARDLATGLHPVGSHREDLAESLKELAHRIDASEQFTCRFLEEGTPTAGPDDFVANHLYRIAQEAVGNAIRHSGGDEVTIELSQSRKHLTLTVRDNGAGFDPENDNLRGLGRHTMEYRARAIGAAFSVRPDPEGGTRVECSLRVPESAAHSGGA